MERILQKLKSPEDLKQLSKSEMDILCEEIRELIIQTVSSNGGHLASNLGVVELTLALNLVFSPPKDSIVWDVGHQSYTYKILTGRYEDFSTIRKEDGLAGFPCREESEYDVFTSGHSSTSISAALGIAEANRLKNEKDKHVVAVIGDGALSGGLAYEGLNNAGRVRRNFIVILNDNKMSISKNVGSMARYLSYMRSNPGYIKTKINLETLLKKAPFIGNVLARAMRASKSWLKKMFYSSNIFEDFGFTYYGPFEGHNVEKLVEVLENAKQINRPVLLHVVTDKGKGYEYAENSPTIYHGLAGFDIETGETGASAESFSAVFGKTICELAEKNDKICAITAAMKSGTGLDEFWNKYKPRFYDVGIAEGHAVTFAAGLAAQGMVPIFAVYSTFLQRSYDELIHDVSLQGLKVVLAIDRAGVVGEDGKTHQGVFDTAYLQTIPNITVFSPTYFSELKVQLAYLVNECDKISAIRYPRGKELYKPRYFKTSCEAFDIYGQSDAETAIITFGRLFSFAAEAEHERRNSGKKTALIKLNRIIPLDKKLFDIVTKYKRICFFEEGLKAGGIGESFACGLYEHGYKGDFCLKAIENPFILHAPMYRSLEKIGFSTEEILKTIETEEKG